MGPSCFVRNSNKGRFPRNKKTGHKAGHLDPYCSEIKDLGIYKVCKYSNETGYVSHDLATLWTCPSHGG